MRFNNMTLVTDLAILSSKSAKVRRAKIKTILDFAASPEFAKDKFPTSTLRAKLLSLGDVAILRKIERGEYEN